MRDAYKPRSRSRTVTFSERNISPLDISHALLIVHSFLQRHPTNAGHINILLRIEEGRKGDNIVEIVKYCIES